MPEPRPSGRHKPQQYRTSLPDHRKKRFWQMPEPSQLILRPEHRPIRQIDQGSNHATLQSALVLKRTAIEHSFCEATEQVRVFTQDFVRGLPKIGIGRITYFSPRRLIGAFLLQNVKNLPLFRGRKFVKLFYNLSDAHVINLAIFAHLYKSIDQLRIPIVRRIGSPCSSFNFQTYFEFRHSDLEFPYHAGAKPGVVPTAVGRGGLTGFSASG